MSIVTWKTFYIWYIYIVITYLLLITIILGYRKKLQVFVSIYIPPQGLKYQLHGYQKWYIEVEDWNFLQFHKAMRILINL